MRYYIRTKLIIQQITKNQIVKGQIKKLILQNLIEKLNIFLIPKFLFLNNQVLIVKSAQKLYLNFFKAKILIQFIQFSVNDGRTDGRTD